MPVAVGTNSCNSSSCLGATSTPELVTPVRLPPGRFRLATSPISTGSKPISKTMGSVLVAALAANDAGVLLAAIRAPWRPTSSAARAGSRSISFCAQRYSIAMFWPSTYPTSFRPCRKAAMMCAYDWGTAALRNPITGIAGRCARAASGHAAATPPSSSVMNSRRFTRSPRRRGRAPSWVCRGRVPWRS